MVNTNSATNCSELDDRDYAQLLTAAARFLQTIDNQTFEDALSENGVSDAVVAMAVHYFVKNMVPIPIEDVGMQKIDQSAAGSEEKRKDLLTMYLATCLFGYHSTGQFAGLSFGATEKELYAANTIIKTFYDLDNPHCPNPDAGRRFFWPKRSLEEKLKAIVIQRGLDQPDRWAGNFGLKAEKE